MPLLVVCDEGHSLLADPWERGNPADIVGPCCVCGAVARLQDHGGQERPMPSTSPPGYDILGPLHGGVMAGVYRARHRRSGRQVALKLSTSGQDGGRGRIRREARALGGLDHPNIVRLLNVGVAGHLAFFSMEWLPGGTLTDRLCGGPLDPREAIRMAAKLADAAHHAHGRRVIHRDIRPSNVVFTDRGEPVLVDFGIAKRLERPYGRTRNGAMVGDPGTWPPSSVSTGLSGSVPPWMSTGSVRSCTRPSRGACPSRESASWNGCVAPVPRSLPPPPSGHCSRRPWIASVCGASAGNRRGVTPGRRNSPTSCGAQVRTSVEEPVLPQPAAQGLHRQGLVTPTPPRSLQAHAELPPEAGTCRGEWDLVNLGQWRCVYRRGGYADNWR
jgi:serine/threonine protein kinase